MKPSQFDVIVLGGGIIGALSAYEIAKTGKKVVLLERYSFGYGASGNSAAMLETQLDSHRGEPFLSLARASNALFPSLHKEIKNSTGIDFQFETCGILQLALTVEEKNQLEKDVRRQKEMGFSVRWMEPEHLKNELPDLTMPNVGGAFYAEDGQVQGNLFLDGALAAAKKSGVLLVEKCGKTSFILDKENSIKGVRTENQQEFGAEKIILATGAWTDEVLAPLNIKLGIEPIRGQLIVYDSRSFHFPFPVYTKKDGYITPKRDGTTLAGTTVEKVGFENSVTKEGEKKISTHAHLLVEKTKTLSIKKMTTGLRPKSPDELPILGPLPSQKNLFVAAGHYRNGILLAPITAKVVTDFVNNHPFSISIDSFIPQHNSK